ncbi:MAG: hypothetical protein P8Y03_18085, partial [Anaerolineales bacterium]
MKIKHNSIFAWVFFGLIAASVLAAMAFYFSASSTGEKPHLFELIFPLVPILFAFVGALIISRQPRNVIGLLMMLPGVSLTFVVDAYLRPYLTGQIPPPVS